MNKKFLSMAICALFFNVYACAPTPIYPTPSVSASVDVYASPSPSLFPSTTPTPTGSASPVARQYVYNLPLKITNTSECDGNAGAKTAYEITADGNYTFISLADNEKYDARKLTSTEVQNIIQLLKDLDLAKLAESDKAVAPGTPQTTECRTIENFTMNVNGTASDFDRNGRKFIHSKDYFDALTKLKSKLDELKTINSTQKYSYTLPLKITNANECSAAISERTLYEVKDDGTFSYIADENDLTNIVSRKLTSTELVDVRTVINKADVALQAEKDILVPAGSPRTEECRTIENTKMVVNGSEKAFDRNGRQLTHAQEYLNALALIKIKLLELSKK